MKVVVIRKGHRSHSNAGKRRKELWNKQKARCFYCRCKMTKTRGLPNTVTLEHRLPLSRGGNHSRKNLAATCSTCNKAKGGQTEDEFIQLPKIAA